jgi:hypothetical protein
MDAGWLRVHITVVNSITRQNQLCSECNYLLGGRLPENMYALTRHALCYGFDEYRKNSLLRSAGQFGKNCVDLLIDCRHFTCYWYHLVSRFHGVVYLLQVTHKQRAHPVYRAA